MPPKPSKESGQNPQCGQAQQPSGTGPIVEPKPWEELSSDQRIERLRNYMKGLIIDIEFLRFQNKAMKEQFMIHQHNQHGELVYVTAAQTFGDIGKDPFSPGQDVIDRINDVKNSKFI